MPKHVRITPAGERLLKRFLDKSIVDLVARQSEGKVNEGTGGLEVADLGIVSDTGERVLIWVRAFEIVEKLEGFLLEISTDFAIQKWPGGPLYEWETISEKVAGFSRSIVTSIGVLERLYDRQTYGEYLKQGLEATCVDEALVIGLENSQVLLIRASLEAPTHLEVFSLNSEDYRQWSLGKKIRIVGERKDGRNHL